MLKTILCLNDDSYIHITKYLLNDELIIVSNTCTKLHIQYTLNSVWKHRCHKYPKLYKPIIINLDDITWKLQYLNIILQKKEKAIQDYLQQSKALIKGANLGAVENMETYDYIIIQLLYDNMFKSILQTTNDTFWVNEYKRCLMLYNITLRKDSSGWYKYITFLLGEPTIKQCGVFGHREPHVRSWMTTDKFDCSSDELRIIVNIMRESSRVTSTTQSKKTMLRLMDSMQRCLWVNGVRYTVVKVDSMHLYAIQSYRAGRCQGNCFYPHCLNINNTSLTDNTSNFDAINYCSYDCLIEHCKKRFICTEYCNNVLCINKIPSTNQVYCTKCYSALYCSEQCMYTSYIFDHHNQCTNIKKRMLIERLYVIYQGICCVRTQRALVIAKYNHEGLLSAEPHLRVERLAGNLLMNNF